MKDNLFEMLLSLFETSLNQLQKSHESIEKDSLENISEDPILTKEEQIFHVKSAQSKSVRILTYDEQMKLTKASYQFLMKMKLWGVLDREVFEIVLNQLHFSESRIVNLQETKWTIRNVLASHLSEEQLSFLDLVLYQTEDALPTH